MPYGRPDWSMPWALWGGSVIRASGANTITPADDTDIISISGKGQTLSGWIKAASATHILYNELTVTIDGAVIMNLSTEKIRDQNLILPYSSPIFLTLQNDVGFINAYAFTPHITFEISFIVNWSNIAGANNVTITHDLAYSSM